MIEHGTLNVIRQIQEAFGLPAEVEQYLSAYDTILHHHVNRDSRESEVIKAAATETVAAALAGNNLPDVGTHIAAATADDRISDAVSKVMQQALDIAGSRLRGAGAEYADAIVTECMGPKVDEAIETIKRHKNTIPVVFDDASAFNSPKNVQTAWREVKAASDVISTALGLRNRMGNVGLDDRMPGTLEHVLVGSSIDFYPNTPLIVRLLTHAQKGATFMFATTSEIAAAQQKQAAERKSKEWQPGARRVVSV